MLLSLGTYTVQLHQWDSKAEAQNYLKNCILGWLELGESLYSSTCYTITLIPENDRFGIGIYADASGLSPYLLLNQKHLHLIMGWGNCIWFIHAKNKRLIAEHQLGHTLFHQFITLSHIGIDDFFLAQDELGITAISYDGQKLWRYSAKDVITGLAIEENHIFIQLMDSLTIRLDMLTGKMLS